MDGDRRPAFMSAATCPSDIARTGRGLCRWHTGKPLPARGTRCRVTDPLHCGRLVARSSPNVSDRLQSSSAAAIFWCGQSETLHEVAGPSSIVRATHFTPGVGLFMRGFVAYGRVALAGLSLLSAFSGCTDAGRAESPGPARAGGGAPAVPVTIAKVERKSMPLELIAIGTVEASASVAVRAQITGELTSVHFKEGDDVMQGQVLFTLDRRPLEAALKQAEANLARDLAQAA